jgi:putative nucleotidyltransferase with HDIG domain
MKQDQISKIINEVQKLPTLPAVANKVTKLLKDPTCTAIRVSEVIDKDPSLTIRVLRLVNSAFYSMRTEVTNVRHAVALLGFKTISQMVITISVFDVFKGGYGREFDREGFWKHSIGCAVISQKIAQLSNYAGVDDCFTAGLLHDIGKVVVDQYLHEEMEKVIRLTQEHEISFADAEKEIMGVNHADIGGQVMNNWKIPARIMVAVKYHHTVLEERGNTEDARDPIVDIVRLSDIMCKREKIGYTGDSLLPQITEDLYLRLNTSKEAIDLLIESTRDEIEKAGIFIELT